ncbi:single-stranded DNA-binding protein [Xylanimonas protaetiae]|uniref:Single-stranded DNA-binding protein n=1 Tax=Xylanimonas protaetiae TaxID=2509457 RepID=A0A4P6F6N2_9MICO|nr:single-stranded DNA-binding protein [Xylanimonas protaetiae]QAY70453.1 single-stranded DNA-binding protein [Xylanimonas protaetiae]
MSDVNVTVVGHVGQDPTLYTAESGTRWTSIRVASTRRVRDPRSGEWGDGPTMWFTVRAFGDRALNLVDSVRKGTPVVVTGRLAVEEYEVRKQEKGPAGEAVEVREPRTSHVIESAVVAVDLSRGVVRYTRTVHTGAVPSGAPDAVTRSAGEAAGGERWETRGDAAAPWGEPTDETADGTTDEETVGGAGEDVPEARALVGV